MIWVSGPTKLAFFTFVDPAVFRNIPAYQQGLGLTALYYWFPAVLAYLVLVLTPVGSRLKLTKRNHRSLFIANIVVALYLIAKFLASTIEGGGASFAVASYSIVIFYPAWFLIIFTFALIAISSIRLRSIDAEDIPPNIGCLMGRRDWGLVTTAFAIPVIFGIYLGYGDGTAFQKARASAPIFDEKCKSAGDEVHSVRNGAKGVLFRLGNSSFGYIKEGRYGSRGWGVLGESFLHRKLLQFIEFQRNSRSLKNGENVIFFRKDSSESKEYRVEAPKSEYVVIAKDLVDDQEKSIGLSGRKVEIIDLRTHEVVASSTYFASTMQRRFCGFAPEGAYSVRAFIIRSLNLKPITK